MAYDSSKENHTTLATIDKNDRGEKFVVSHITVKGSSTEYIDIRLMYTPDGSTELRPTTKGVRFNKEFLVDVMESLVSVLSDEESERLTDVINESFGEE